MLRFCCAAAPAEPPLAAVERIGEHMSELAVQLGQLVIEQLLQRAWLGSVCGLFFIMSRYASPIGPGGSLNVAASAS